MLYRNRITSNFSVSESLIGYYLRCLRNVCTIILGKTSHGGEWNPSSGIQ